MATQMNPIADEAKYFFGGKEMARRQQVSKTDHP